VVAAAALAGLGLPPGGLCAAVADSPLPGQAVVGSVGNDHITLSDVIAHDQEAFNRLKSEHDLSLRQLDREYARARHDLVQQELDKLLDRRALELEAAARGQTPAAISAEIKAPAVTDEEARAFYQARKDRTNQSYEELASTIKQYLASERYQHMSRSFYDGLRSKYGIRSTLGPYRVAVAATGPTRGKAEARITIVEFGDFQCPFCQRAETTLRTILQKYPDDVRLVFRNLPLTEVHPNAALAAQAGVCANRQGKFWEMHDAMFKDQSALGADSLKNTAQQLGLDPQPFASCLDSRQEAARVVDDDAEAAADLGINSTPFFFVNGRPVKGNVALEQFEKIIAEELSAGRQGS
jgi:protein-disulfide isomerase